MEELRPIFVGKFGVRAGWRIALWIFFLALFGLLIGCAFFLATQFHLLPKPSPSFDSAEYPGIVIVGEGAAALAVLGATALMCTILRDRPWRRFGLGLTRDSTKLLGYGFGIGLGALAILVVGLELTGAMTLQSTLAQTSILFAVGWLAAQFCVAILEETMLRGYLLATLSDGIGFWPAALGTSAIFGLVHIGNGGESWFGALSAGLVGVAFCLCVRRTGSLWLSIGIHTGWNWAESYLFGTANSGSLAVGHLLQATSHGNKWLSGGSVGPEGSILVLPTILLIALTVHRFWRKPTFLAAGEQIVAEPIAAT